MGKQDNGFFKFIGFGGNQQTTYKRGSVDNAGEMSREDQAKENSTYSLDPLDITGSVLSGAYYSRQNLARLDLVSYNLLAKTIRSEAVAKADLYLKQTNSEGEEDRYTAQPNLTIYIEQIQEYLGEIEMSRMITGYAYLYYEQSARKFVLVPFDRVTRRVKGKDYQNDDFYGIWNRNRDGSNSIELTAENTIRIGITGSISPQAAALPACLTYLKSTRAGDAILNNKITGLDKIITAPMSDEEAKQANQNLTANHGGADKQQGLAIMAISKGKPEDVRVHDVSPRDNKLPYLPAIQNSLRAIAAAYQIPNPLIGDNTQTSYNNVSSADKRFQRTTIQNQWTRIVKDLTDGFRRLFNLPDGICVSYSHPSIYSELDEIAPNIDSLLKVLTKNEIREQIGREPVEDEDETPEPVEQDEEDQEEQNERIGDYLKRGVKADEIIENELFRLNQLYNRDELECILTRSIRFVKQSNYSGNAQDIISLVRFIHIDYYIYLGFSKFGRVVHTGEHKCSTNCNKRSLKLEEIKSILSVCRCLIYPKI